MSSEWRVATAAELQSDGVLLVQDGNHGEYRPRPHDFVDIGIPFIRAADLGNGAVLFNQASRINVEAFDRITKGIGAPGDTLVSHKGTVGRVAWAPYGCELFVCSPQTTFWRSVDPKQLEPRYMFAYARSPLFQRQLAMFQGESDMAPYVSLTVQRTMTVALPPIDEQRRIAGVLGALDDKIEHNVLINGRLEDCCSTVMDEETSQTTEWFALGDVVQTLETGSRPRGGISGYTSGVPSIGAESIVGLGIFDYAKTKYVPEDFFLSMKRGVLQSGDVLLYKDGGRPGMFEPHVTLVGNGFPYAVMSINEHVYRLRARRPYSQEFLYFWLRSKVATEEMRVRGTGVAVPGLNSEAVKALAVPVIGERRLTDLSARLAPAVNSILANARANRHLESIRDLVLPKLVSGQIRVPDSYDPDDVLGTVLAEEADAAA